MRVISQWALCLWLLSVPATAAAQPVWAENATLRAGDDEVGWLADAPATIRTWTGAREAELHYEDEVITLDAEVALTGDTTLLASPGQVVTLERTGAFTIEMLPGTLARVVERDVAGRLRIRLPDTLPRDLASMPLGSPSTPSAPAAVEPPDDWQSICEPTRVLARASRHGGAWMVDGPSARAEVGPPRDGLYPVRVWIDGYVVHGFLEHALPTDRGCGSGSGSSACGGTGHATRTRVTLPAGTQLFAGPSGATPLATLRLPHVATMVDRGDIPDAPVAWHVERVGDGPRWSLEVWLREDADVLRSYPRPPDP